MISFGEFKLALSTPEC